MERSAVKFLLLVRSITVFAKLNVFDSSSILHFSVLLSYVDEFRGIIEVGVFVGGVDVRLGGQRLT